MLEFTHTFSLELEKGARSRDEEESLVAERLIWELGAACTSGSGSPPKLRAAEQPQVDHHAAPAAWQALLKGEIARAGNAAAELTAIGPGISIFPGAFRPFHDGHRRMIAIAERRLNQPVSLEISILNVDKPPLNYTEMDQRGAALPKSLPLWFTRAPTFVEKSAVFPGCTFIVGADTVVRIAQPKYYQHDIALRDEALATLAARGCRFLVFGRLDDGDFRTLDELDLPERLRNLCDEVSEEEFRADVSSSELRQQSQQQQ
jgi:hypothetical protein